MKDGAETRPLSARLAALKETTENASQTDRFAVSMRSSLESFRSDCEASLKAARATMQSDLDEVILSHRRALVQSVATIRADLKPIARLTRFGPWVATLTLATIAATIFAAGWFWERAMMQELRESQLMTLGFAATPTRAGLALTWSPTRLRLAECRQADKPTPCLIVQEGR